MPLDSTTATTTASRPISPLPQPHAHSHPHHHYPSPQQQTLPIRAPNPPLLKPPSQQQNFAFPYGSGSFGPKVRGLAASDHAAAYPPPSLMYSSGVRGMHLDYLNHALHVTRPVPHVPVTHLGNATPTASPSVKKAAARSVVSDINGYKDTSTRERSKDDTYIVVRDRKANSR